MMTISGCANSSCERINVPGHPGAHSYGINFDLDWDVYDAGTFSYGQEGSTFRQMGGGRSGYELFYDLTLDFKLKDGREYYEKIDLRPLIKTMLENHELPDLSKSKWGGSAFIEIIVKTDKLSIVYYILQRRRTKDGQRVLFHKSYCFPVFEKTLN